MDSAAGCLEPTKLLLTIFQHGPHRKCSSFSPPLKRPQETWARNNAEKAHAFAKHLETSLSTTSLRKYP
jgi:hypothetical protein